jgi:hypothetical protein
MGCGGGIPASGEWRAEAVAGLFPRFISSVTPDGNQPEILEPVAIEDVSTEPLLARRTQAHADEGVVSLLLVPFVSNAKTAGAAVFSEFLAEASILLANSLESCSCTAARSRRTASE